MRVKITLTGTMIPTVPALSAGMVMNSTSIRAMGATGDLPVFRDEHHTQSAEERGQDLGKGRLQHRGVEDGGQRGDEQHAQNDDQGGDDGGNGDGDGGDYFALFRVDLDLCLIEGVERHRQL